MGRCLLHAFNELDPFPGHLLATIFVSLSGRSMAKLAHFSLSLFSGRLVYTEVSQRLSLYLCLRGTWRLFYKRRRIKRLCAVFWARGWRPACAVLGGACKAKSRPLTPITMYGPALWWSLYGKSSFEGGGGLIWRKVFCALRCCAVPLFRTFGRRGHRGSFRS